MEDEREHYRLAWRRLAARTRLLVNTGWILTSLTLPLLGALVTCSILIISGRRVGISTTGLWYSTAALIALAAGFSVSRARPKFISLDDAYELLDEEHTLRNRLSASCDGAFAWPALPRSARSVRLSVKTQVGAFLCGGAMVIAAALVPLPSKQSKVNLRTAKPAQIAALEHLLEDLEEEKLLNPRSIEELRKKIDVLTSTEEGVWYAHDTLEAADALAASALRDLVHLQNQLSELERTLNELSVSRAHGQGSRAAQLFNEFTNKAQELRGASVEPSEDLAKALENAARQDALTLSHDESQALSELLRRHSQGLGQGQKKNVQSSLPDPNKRCKDSTTGQVDGMCTSPSTAELQGRNDSSLTNEGSAQSGRGGGSAPLDLREKPPQLTSSLEESITGPIGKVNDKSGDLVGLTSQAPQAEAATGLASGGVVADSGAGGQVSWQQELSPEEQEIVRGFYK